MFCDTIETLAGQIENTWDVSSLTGMKWVGDTASVEKLPNYQALYASFM